VIDETNFDSQKPVLKAKASERFPSGVRKSLADVVDQLIADSLAGGAINEGVVTSVGPMPYRRLDCDGRALAYIRVRPKKGHVRIDITGLWLAQRAPRLRIPGAAGTIALAVADVEEAAEAAVYLRDTVQRTRDAFTASSRRR
jgi:hypothetical protein